MLLAELAFRFSASLAILFFLPVSFQARDSTKNSAQSAETGPKASADQYPAHAKAGTVTIGAELLTGKQASQTFTADINRCCLVVQVAVYPEKGQAPQISIDDFTLIQADTSAKMKAERVSLIVEQLEPAKGSNSGVSTTTSASIGYESGEYTDPVTGQPVKYHGTTRSASVGVQAGGGDVPPTVVQQVRESIERELRAKALPGGKAVEPVSGYLYFLTPKHKRNAKYRLEYLIDGNLLNLSLP
jgi:hypothetical protein